MPSRCAAYATAWAWLPLDCATTPRDRSSAVSAASRFIAPRILNAPVGWRLSGFSQSRRPSGRSAHGQGSSGVRTAVPAIRRWAARRSSRSTRVIPGPSSGVDGALTVREVTTLVRYSARCSGNSLTRFSHFVESTTVVRVRATPLVPESRLTTDSRPSTSGTRTFSM